MSTAQTIISGAMSALGALPSGDTPTTAENTDGLAALNRMLDTWRNEQLMVYAMRDESFSLVVGTKVYTIGPSGTGLVTTRPIEIEHAWILSGTISYDVDVIDNEQYDAIGYKDAQSTWPDRLNYTPDMPNGTITVYPVPTAVNTLHMRTRTPLTAFSATTDTVSLPPGWEEAMIYNLAIRLAPTFQKEPSATVVQLARETKAAVKIVNSRLIKGSRELSNIFPSRRGNILAGDE